MIDRQNISLFTTVAASLWALCLPASAQPIGIADVTRTEAVSFEKDILPILQRNCLACHSAVERQGDLVLESPDAIRRGGDSGPAVVPAKGGESLLIRLASHQEDPAMPPPDNDVAAKNLTPEELGLVRLWIDQGATGSGSLDTLSPTAWSRLPKQVQPVNAIDLTADGQYVAFSRGNRLLLYHVPTGKPITQLMDPALNADVSGTPGVAHRDLIQSLTFNADGDLLASGGFREVKIWRRPGDVQLFKIPAVADAASVAVSADKEWLAVPGENFSVRLFRAASGEQGPMLSGHTDRVTALRFTADSSCVVSGSVDGTIRGWSVADGLPVAVIETPAPVNAVEFVPVDNPTEEVPVPGQLLISGGDDNLVRVWNLPSTAPLKLPVARQNARLFAHSHDRGMLVVVSGDNTIEVIRVNVADGSAGVESITAWAADAPVTAVAVSRYQDADVVLTGHAGGRVQMWKVADHQVLARWQSGASDIRAVAATIDSLRIAVGSDDKVVRLWDAAVLTDAAVEEKTPLHELPEFPQPISSLVFNSAGDALFAAAADGSFRGYAVSDARQLFATGHGAAVNDIALSADGTVIATAGENAQVRLWQTNGGGFGRGTIAGFSGPVRHVGFSADGKQLIAATAGDAAAVQVFDITDGVIQQKFTQHAGDAVGLLTLPTNHVLTASAGGLWQWEPAAVRQLAGHSQPVTSLAAIPDSPRQVMSGGRDNTMRHWSLDDGSLLRQFNHGGAITAIAVSPDAQLAASASDNNRARLWRMNGQQVAEMRGDIRLATTLTRRQQEQNTANARLALVKRLLDTAEKDVPTKTTAETTLSEALTKATQEVKDKTAALETATTEKLAAEKAAVEAAAIASQALAAKDEAQRAVDVATRSTQVLQARVTRLQQLQSSDPQNEDIRQLVLKAQEEFAAAQKTQQELTSAVQEPMRKYQEVAKVADDAARKVNEVQKPYSDALAALKKAKADESLVTRQHELATQERKLAEELVPVRKEAVTAGEAAVEAAKQAVEQAQAELQAAEMPLRAIAFSPDGTILATAGDFPAIHTWDTEKGTAVASFAGHTAAIHGLAFVDDQRLLSIGADSTAVAWEVNPAWELERTIGSVDNPSVIAHRVTAVDFNRGADRLLIAGGIPSRSGELQVFNVADGTQVMRLEDAHEDVIYAARFSPDGLQIASAGADRYVRTFDVSKAEQLRRFEGHTDHVLGITWKGDGQTIVSSSADNTIKVWDAETGDQSRSITNINRHITAVRYIGETDNVVSASGDKLVRMHTATNANTFRNFGGAASWLHCVSVTPDSNTVAAGDAKGNVYLWNGNNGQIIHTLQPVAEETLTQK